MGWSLTQLRRRMTEREFEFWHAYAQCKTLPARHMELSLANLALVIAQVMTGSKTLKLADFLLFEKTAKPAAPGKLSARDGASMFGGKVHKLGQKSRKAPRG